MRRALLGLIAVFGVFLAVSCGSSDSGSAPVKGGKVALDATPGDGEAVVPTDGLHIEPPDGGANVTGEADTTGGAGPTGAIEDPTRVPEPGQLGWPCKGNGDCDSGWCINSAAGQVCTEFCVDDCAIPSWTCVQVSQAGADVAYVCVPRFSRLCDPCAQNEDCIEFEGQAGNVCINYGEQGSFCGASCEAPEDCPLGYSCQTLPTAEAAQCIPVASSGAPKACECSKLATSLGKSTSCFNANGAGTCYGYRECAPGGLTDCSAALPQNEICNGQDDNCDNVVDNITVPETCEVTNDQGTCVGVLLCNPGLGTGTCDAATPMPEICDGLDQNCNGVADDGFADNDGDLLADQCMDEDDDNDGILDVVDNCQLVPNPDQLDFEGDGIGDACDNDDDNDGDVDATDCQPKDPTVSQNAPEICDGKDNDCDLEIDEGLCDDGNLCTDDKCNTDGSCTQTPNQIACDDQSVCTQKDVCKDGACVGLNPIPCDDNNPCTTDACEPAVGCVFSNNTAPCEDGNQCTANDTCQNGVCKSGPQKDCSDNNPCTQAVACSTQTGCLPPIPLTGQYCKYSTHPFCGAGVCSNGQCTPQAGMLCDDDDACTVSDHCSGGVCVGGAPYNCDQACQAQGPFCIALGTCVEIFSSPSCLGGCLCP